jgi:glucose/mannose-6-phosphate isomerase
MDELLQFPRDYLQFDKSNLLSQYRQLSNDIEKAYDLGNYFPISNLKEPVDHIFFLGMGGSSIAFEFIKSYLTYLGVKKSITIVRDYIVPNHMTKNSLVFVASYSGNTEETLSAYKMAFRVTPNIFSMSSGGKLKDLCVINKTPYMEVPSGFQPRTAAISYMFFPFLKVLETLGVIENQKNSIAKISSTISKPSFIDLAISISEKLVDKIPLIYSSSLMYPVAYRMKTAINENAKVHSFCHEYSELNHNEMVGYTNLKGNFHIVVFKFNHDHRRLMKRMDLTKEITNTKGVATTEIALNGEDFLTKIFSAVYIGDLISIYLALRYKTDPSPVQMVEEFKTKLGPFVL